ncbi:MAG: S9 family peptidase [Bryobacterales bacterium]|nr:S9 family peptidase [Bryobacterales bacterium]
MRTLTVCSLLFLLAGCSSPKPESAEAEDPNLWLEDIEGDKPLAWVREQNERTLKELEADPRYQPMYDEALAILTSKERIPMGQIHGGHVYNFWQDDEHVRGLWRRATVDSYRTNTANWETLLDMDALAESEHENWIWHGYDCLGPDYKLCLVDLSRGGSDASVLREFSLETKEFVAGGFQTPDGKNGAEWLDADTLLVSSDWGGGRTDSGYAREVRRWRRGQPFEAAEPVFEGEKTDVATGASVLRHAGKAYPLIERAVTFYESEYHWLKPSGELADLPLPKRVRLGGVFQGELLLWLQEPWKHDDVDYAEGDLAALRFDDMTARLLFHPAENQSVDGVAATQSSIVVTLLEDVAGKALRIRDGKATQIKLPANGVLSLAGSSGDRDDFFLIHESLTTPQTLLHVSAANKVSASMALPAFYDAAGVVVEQHFAKSKDGTRVPYFVMGKKEVLEKGNAPTIQYGYGGFLIPVLPVYYEDPSRPQHGALAGKLWISRGGVLVLSNIRGGGEYGPRWHDAALKENRQRAYDDFFAISEDLIKRGVTTPEKLGAIGRSNGGLLMGVALTQRPDLYHAIDCGVPLFDMKRYNKLLAGASWMGEYGNPDVPEEWAYISQYSPYQNLKSGQPYPKVLFYTSTKDDRVHPGHARKAAARMAELGYDFYYYENIEGGHGGTANQKQLAMRTALEYAYFAHELMPTQ